MTNEKYLERIKEMTPQKLREEGYIRIEPKIPFGENEEVKSYIRISFDHFIPSKKNSYYRDCIIEFDIFCHPEYWDLGNYRQRPIKIAGYIDGILNETKLSGIGTLQFISGNELLLNGELNGYCLIYKATHGADDLIPEEE